MGRHEALSDLGSFAREFAERVTASFFQGGIVAAGGLWGTGAIGVHGINDLSDAKRAVLSVGAAVGTAAASAAYNTAKALIKTNGKRLETDASGALNLGQIGATVVLHAGPESGTSVYGSGGGSGYSGHASTLPKPLTTLDVAPMSNPAEAAGPVPPPAPSPLPRPDGGPSL